MRDLEKEVDDLQSKVNEIAEAFSLHIFELSDKIRKLSQQIHSVKSGLAELVDITLEIVDKGSALVDITLDVVDKGSATK